MKNSKGYKIFNFVMKIISWCVMSILLVIGAFLIVYLCINKIAQSQGKNAPLGLYTIISPSMTPDIDVYDVVVVVYKDPQEIEVGDIVSYYSTNSYFGDTPITHRVVEKFNTNNGVSFRTRGDANPVVDNEIVMADHVIGTVRFVIPGLGRIQFFLASKGGWFIAILVPAAGIIIYDLVKLAKLMSVKNKMKYAEELENEKSKKDKRKSYERKIQEERRKLEKENKEEIKKQIKETREEKYKRNNYKETEYEEDKIAKMMERLNIENDETPSLRTKNSNTYRNSNNRKTSKRK